MTNQEIEAKLKTAVEHAVPDVWDQIMARCAQAQPSAPVLDLSEGGRRKKRRSPGRLMMAAAALLLLLGGAGGYGHYQNNYVACASVGLDVNPSLEFSVSRSERIIDVQALNDDAKAVLDAVETKGRPLDDALDDVVGVLMAQGYLREEANAVLVTIQQPDAVRGEALAEKVASEVETSMAQRALDGAVLSQTLTQGETLRPQAEHYGISVGKMALIDELAAGDTQRTAEELKDLSINELGTLLTSPQTETSAVKLQGTPSDKAYIGADQALRLAQAAADLTELQAHTVWLDAPKGRMVYQITLTAPSTICRYTLDAYSGEVLTQSREDTPPEDTSSQLQADSTAPAQQTASPNDVHQYKDVGQNDAAQYKEMGQDYADHYQEVGQDHADEYKDKGQEYADQYKDVGQNYADQYKEMGQDYADQYKEMGQEYADQYKEVGQDYADEYKEKGQDYADQYKEMGQHYADQYKNTGQDYADHYKEAVQDHLDAFKNADTVKDETDNTAAADDTAESGSQTDNAGNTQNIGQHYADEYKETAQHYIDQFTGGRDRAAE